MATDVLLSVTQNEEEIVADIARVTEETETEESRKLSLYAINHPELLIVLREFDMFLQEENIKGDIATVFGLTISR